MAQHHTEVRYAPEVARTLNKTMRVDTTADVWRDLNIAAGHRAISVAELVRRMIAAGLADLDAIDAHHNASTSADEADSTDK